MIRIGVPSKGRLMEDTFAWFGARGLKMRRSGAEREYSGTADLPGVQPVFLSAGEIPRELAAGRIHLGVTGSDLVREQLGEDEVEELARLGVGQADLIIGNNVYAHVPDINDFTRGLQAALQPNGTITLEFPHLMRLLDHTQFDTI